MDASGLAGLHGALAGYATLRICKNVDECGHVSDATNVAGCICKHSLIDRTLHQPVSAVTATETHSCEGA